MRERGRVLAPAIWLCSVAMLVVAHALGIAGPTWSEAVCWAIVLVAAVLAAAFMLRKIPERYLQIASSANLWLPAAMTAIAMYETRVDAYAAVLIALVASAGVLLHRTIAFATIATTAVVGTALVARCGGPYAGLYIGILWCAAMSALLIHVLMSRALLRAEALRGVANEAATQLAARLDELQSSHAERARLQEQLLHAQRMEALGTLAAGIAHDMNNVLASISTLAGLLASEADPETIRSDAEEILAQTERGASLTRSLLAFSRRGQYRKRPLRLWDLVRGLAPMLERTLPKSIEIRCSLDGDVVVEADPTHIEQVLVNLALNANDAMAGAGTLSLTGDVADGRARLRVQDTGCGMDEATRQRVFEPFFTTKGVGKGTGLGLSTVWGIVQAHGGTISVDSEPGKGATFTVLLPVSQAAPVKLSRPSTSPGAASLRGVVLVVDDEPAVRRSTTRALERMGVRVLAAASGAEALALFGEHPEIDAVLLDMAMPGMSGAECFERLREQRDVPVLVATGYAVDHEAQQLVAKGAVVLEKPFTAVQLRREIARLLARTRPSSVDADPHE